MPRKFLKRIMPDHHRMREHPYLQRFGQRLTEPKLWHLNRRSVAGGLALGVFIAFLPVLGQMVIAAAFAILLRLNLPVAVMSVWITNPFTIAPIYYFSYKVGTQILSEPLGQYAFNWSLEWFGREFAAVWQPLLLGSVICGLLAALLSVVFVRLIWRLVVIRNWLARRHSERQKHHSPK